MKLIVKEYDFTSNQGWTHSFDPDDANDFVVEVCIAIGEVESNTYDRFYIVVCSPNRILYGDYSKLDPDSGIVNGRHKLIMKRYNESALKQYIESYVDALSELPWEQQLALLCRLGRWEFEDSMLNGEIPETINIILTIPNPKVYQKLRDWKYSK